MNRRYSCTPRGQTNSPPCRDKLQTQNSNRATRSRQQASVKQDINIDDFGDMGSDEDDFQTLSRNFLPPKPPAQPQYNLVPYGFLRDDDELVEEDYDGVPIDDTSSIESPKKQPWERSPRTPHKEEVKGAPITVLGSSFRADANLKWPSRSQDSAPRDRPGLVSSSTGSEAGRWDKKGEPLTTVSLANDRHGPSRAGADRNVRKAPSFARSIDGLLNPFLETSNKPASSSTINFVRSADETNPFMRGNQNSSGRATSIVSSKDSSTALHSHGKTLLWSDKPKPVQSSTPAWAERDRGFSQSLKVQGTANQNALFTPTTVASTPSQLEIIQAAALQQALTGLTKLGSQSGLNLLEAQNLLMQASQNPALAAALVAGGGMLNTGLGSFQPNTLSNPTIETLLKSAANTTVPDTPQSNLGLLSYPLRSNIKGNSSSTSRRPIPDGSGSTRYPAPDLSSLVFDPSTGYRFDASSGLHYDANSGYFFNSELKLYLRWDKFTQTYLKVDNPPGVPHVIDSSTERMSYMKDSSLTSQDKGQQSSGLPVSPFVKHSLYSSNNFLTGSSGKESQRGLNPLREGHTSSLQKEFNTVQPPIIPTDFSKPPPALPHMLNSSSGAQLTTANPQSPAEQKAAALPNYAETSLFNKLRKAKLAQTAQAKLERRQWGSPDPLLEAIQKQAAETDKSQVDVLNLQEILQRSRQFMNEKTDDLLVNSDNLTDRHTSRGRNHRGAQRKFRSRSRSVGRPSRRSRSPERSRNRRGRSSLSPQQRRHLARSPEVRMRGKENSSGRSPNTQSRRRPTLSPARNRKPTSRSRSPQTRARGRISSSPESRERSSSSRRQSLKDRALCRASPLLEGRDKRPTSRGRSPLRRKGNLSKSPDTRHGRPISRGRNPERRSSGRRSVSQELRKRRYHSRTPDRSLRQRSQSPLVKVVLDQSPGGSKIRARSPGQINKRFAERGLSAERSKVRRQLSPSNVKSYVDSPKRTKATIGEAAVMTGRKAASRRTGIRENRNDSSEKERITELKPIPYNAPQSSGRKSSGKSKIASGYKSLSNLRNQGKEKPSEKETIRKPDNVQQLKAECVTGRPSIEVDLTVDSDNEKRNQESKNKSATTSSRPSSEVDLTVESDDEKQSRNHRLVSERTFSSVWEKPNSVSQKASTNKTDSKAESKEPKDTIDNKNSNKKDGSEEDKQQLEETNEFDFLTETLDDDKDSTVIDEYEEILDYQDLDETELVEKEPARTVTDSIKEPISSSVIDLCIESGEPGIQTSTSQQFALDKKIAETLPEKSGSFGKVAVAAQGEGKTDVPLGGDKVGDGSCQMGVVNESLDNSASLPDENQKADSVSGKEIEKHKNPGVDIGESGGSSKCGDVSPVQYGASNVRAATLKGGNESNKIYNGATGFKGTLANKVDDSDINKDVPCELATDMLDNEEWNIVDSLDDQGEVSTQSIFTDLNALRKDKQASLKLDLVPKLGANVQSDAVNTKVEENELILQANDANDGIDSQVCQNDRNDWNDVPDVSASKAEKTSAESHLQGSGGSSKEVICESETEEPVPQGRSVSDIEKFLLLSSQEVEAMREQGIESTSSKNEKKSGVFSRLGEKLPAEEAGSEPKVVMELSAEKPVPTAAPPKKVSASAASEGKAVVAKPKPSGDSSTLKKSKKAVPGDPIGRLFNDKPTSQILIGPMNFIEPLPNFQHFTQKYMQRMLQQEGVKFRQVYVCHEDVTGAPYHYILVMFNSIKLASGWLKKHKGKFKCDEKLFTQIPGHTKQKLIRGAEAFMYYTESNWVCKVCRKGNFPPRSLCFGCFQHKNPDGFSPLTILDKGPPPHKSSNFVGTPKLKFFVTKEKVIQSAPPLDGFDIKNIKMIMDEKMGFPAGICVFEMSNYIDAGKLKKYLNHREIEAVSVEMHENPNPDCMKSGPRVVSSRKTPPKGPRDDRLRKPLQDVPVSESDREECRGYKEVRRSQELSPRIPPQKGRTPRGPSPSSSRDSRVPRRRSFSPPREMRVPRRRSPTPPSDLLVSRGRSPPPPLERRVPKGRPLSPSRHVRGGSPSPLPRKLSRDRVQSRSPRRQSPGHLPSTRSPRHVPNIYEEEPYPSIKSQSTREISKGRNDREVSPRYRSRERNLGHRSPVPHRSPQYQSPSRYRSLSPVYDTPRLRSPSPRYRSRSPVRPTKPDGRGEWRYPPPDPTNFRFEPKSGLDYDPTTTLYYEPKSCCFYNDDTNEWLEYDPITGRYILVR